MTRMSKLTGAIFAFACIVWQVGWLCTLTILPWWECALIELTVTVACISIGAFCFSRGLDVGAAGYRSGECLREDWKGKSK